jgi:hypothetical protein
MHRSLGEQYAVISASSKYPSLAKFWNARPEIVMEKHQEIAEQS